VLDDITDSAMTDLARLSPPPASRGARMGLIAAWLVSIGTMMTAAGAVYAERASIVTVWPPAGRLFAAAGAPFEAAGGQPGRHQAAAHQAEPHLAEANRAEAHKPEAHQADTHQADTHQGETHLAAPHQTDQH